VIVTHSLPRDVPVASRAWRRLAPIPQRLPLSLSPPRIMKSVAVLLAALLATSLYAVAADKNKDACVAECRTHLLQQSEKDCAYWRGELPRPDLYNHCQHGHTQGREASCTLLCGSDGQNYDRQLDSQRLDACEEFRGRPPSERVSACNEGFVQARSLAHEVGGEDEEAHPSQ
jgi:hypothetical protein